MPILKHEGKDVYYIDGIPCTVNSVHDDWMSVNIIRTNDFTSEKAFVAKVHGVVAHGETLKEAFQDAHDKYMAEMEPEERCVMFVKEFQDMDKKYSSQSFFDWHGTITGSCRMGRSNFADRHGINLEMDTLTVKEFIDLTINEYGGDTIKMLREKYENSK